MPRYGRSHHGGGISGGGGTTASAASALTNLTLLSTSGSNIPANTFVEFGLPLAVGSLGSGSKIGMVDASAAVMAVQQDQIATDQSGAIRFTKVTALLANAPGATSTVLPISTTAGSPATANPVTAANILAQTISGDTYECTLTATFPDGTVYTAKASDGLSASSTYTYGSPCNFGTVRSGGLVTEFRVQVPFTTGGTPHAFLVAEFFVSAYKRSAIAWNSVTNPIVAVSTQVCLYNGYTTIASPADLVYDLLITQGASSPTTVYQLNGGAGSATITLSATSGQDKTATLSAGTWALSATANSSDVGKAIVEIGGIGRAYINGRQSTTIARVQIPANAAFASTTRLAAAWKRMGVYHYNQSRVVPDKLWFPTSADPANNPVLTTAYIIGSGMVMNYAADATTCGAPDLTLITSDGGHPMGMNGPNNTIKGYGTQEQSTGDADHIGVLSYSQTAALLNWGDSTNHANARALALGWAKAGNLKPYWALHNEYGGIVGNDDAGVYTTDPRSSSRTQLNYTDYLDAGYSSGWFFFALNHSGGTSYLPYLLTGEAVYLQDLAMMAASYSLLTTDGGIMSSQAMNNPSGAGTTAFTVTAASYTAQTGDAVQVSFSGAPQYLGTNLAVNNRFFLRRRDDLSATTFNLFDTYAHAIAGGATGLVTLTGGTGVAFFSGYDVSSVPFAVNTGQPREVAWNTRTLAQFLAVSPDSGGDVIIGRSYTRANTQRRFDSVGTFLKTLYTDDVNYQAGGPRFLSLLLIGGVSSGAVFSMWQLDYYRQALVNAAEAGAFQAGSNWALHFDWLLADCNQWAIRSDVCPHFVIGSYYMRAADTSGTAKYSYNEVYQEAMRYPIGSFTGVGIWGPNGEAAKYTATIASVANQAAVSITLSATGGVNGATGSFFDNANPTRQVGSWLVVGSGSGRITSVTGANSCVVDCTIATQDGITPAGINMATGAGQTTYCTFPSWGNGETIVGNSEDYSIAGTLNAVGTEPSYMWLARSRIEIGKQRGIDTANYTAALAHFTARSMPTNPPRNVLVGAFQPGSVKFNVVSRI